MFVEVIVVLFVVSFPNFVVSLQNILELIGDAAEVSRREMCEMNVRKDLDRPHNY